MVKRIVIWDNILLVYNKLRLNLNRFTFLDGEGIGLLNTFLEQLSYMLPFIINNGMELVIQNNISPN